MHRLLRPLRAGALPRLPRPHLSAAPHRRNSTAPPTTPEPPLSTSLRQTLRRLPHPIIILTTTPTEHTPHGTGITLSTLTCLSLHPAPLITFNIRVPSTTSSAMHASGVFAVHILAGTGHAAWLAKGFARLGGRRGEDGGVWGDLVGEGDVWETEKGAVRMLGLGEGVLARLRCRAEKVVAVQDHEVWVGRVEDVEEGEGGALVYLDGRFRAVGGEVVAARGVRGLGEEE